MRNQKTCLTGYLAIAATAMAMTAPLANAQEASSLSQFQRPYGMGYGAENRPFDARTRDSLGNRLIINGLIEGGSGLGIGLNSAWGQTQGGYGMLGSGSGGSYNQSQALGNQLNVITNGNYNTVIIDSTQINNGDQTVILNGELDLK